VFIALGQGRFEPREVNWGSLATKNNYREVLSGLSGGEEVVTSAQFLLDSESRFREAIQLMMPGKESEGKKEGTPPAMPEMKTGGPKEAPAPMPPGHKH